MSYGISVYGCEPDEAEAFEQLAPRLGIVPEITSSAASEAGALPAPGNRCISVGHKSRLAAPALRALKRAGVEYVSTRSIGFDHIDLDAAEELGILVENVVYEPDGVADYTLMLMLMAIRHARTTLSAVEGSDFSRDGARGRELRDMTVGVVGAGRIGSAVIERLQGFGCRILVHSRSRSAAAAEQASLERLLAESDVVTLHLPLSAETRHVIGPEQLGAMKRGAYLVNTGRGALVDTEALIAALEGGRLAGAALDVLEGEEGYFYPGCGERSAEHGFLQRLQALPTAIVTPHTAYYTERMLRDTVEKTLVNCLNFERGWSDG